MNQNKKIGLAALLMAAMVLAPCASAQDFEMQGGTLVKYHGKAESVSVRDIQNVTELGESCFEGTGIKSIQLPSGLTKIGDYAFYGCKNLEEITIPAAVSSIGKRVFSGCGRLERIVVKKGNPAYKSVDGVLFSKDGKRLIKYPEGRQTIVLQSTGGG